MRKFFLTAFLVVLALPVYAVNIPVQQFDFRVPSQTGGKVLGVSTLSETQIQAILSLLNSFDVDQTIISNVTASLRGTPHTVVPPVSGDAGGVSGGSDGTPNLTFAYACPFIKDLRRTLAQGVRDMEVKDVSKFQQFLVAGTDVYPEGVISGYVGPATVRAIQKLQCQYGIMCSGSQEDGYGVVGPQTRAAIFRLCGYEPTIIPNLPENPNPSIDAGSVNEAVSINYVSYANTVTTPILRGKAQNVSVFGISVDNGDKVYGSGNTIYPINGEWAHQITTPLNPGSYNVKAYNSNNQLIGSGTFSIQPTTVPRPEPPVTPLKVSADLKVNGVDYGTQIVDNAPLTVSWKSYGTSNCFISGSIRLTPNGERAALNNVGTAGEKQMYAYVSSDPYYTHKAVLTCNREDGTGSISDEVLFQPTVTAVPDGSSLTLTAPNGGEQWEIGQLNTITWTPYGYNPEVNPSYQVQAYLMRADGSTVGLIKDTGKASLHTYFNINDYNTWAEPGQYYVYVKNSTTGTSDKSDAPFTLLPKSVDLKVNGSDGPVTLASQKLTIKWTSVGTVSCTASQVGDTLNGSEITNLPPNGTRDVYLSVSAGENTTVSMACKKSNGTWGATDYVAINNFATAGSLAVTSPNGGEILTVGQPYNISWRQTGLKSVSIALYRNDQWSKWIVKDLSITGDNYQSYQWTPTLAELGAVNELGSAFKIYITGQQSSGGYVDDKSDAPFSFYASAPAYPSCSVGSKESVTYGETVEFEWSSTNAVYAVWIRDPSGKDNIYLGGDKLAPFGRTTWTANILGQPFVTLRAYAANGQYIDCRHPLNVSSMYSQSYYQGYYQSAYYSQGAYPPATTYTQGYYQSAYYSQGAYNPPASMTFDFYASPASVSYGASSALSWRVTNARNCFLTGGAWGSGQAVSAENYNISTGALTSTTAYTLTCESTVTPGQFTAKSATVSVLPQYSQSSYGGGGGAGPKVNLN